MASAIKLSYHRRLFFLLLFFSWSIVVCFMGYQYMREKQYKSDFLAAQLQLYNRSLLEIVEEGVAFDDYINSHKQPFDDLRISVITNSGKVIYDNLLPFDLLDNHSDRPEIASAMKSGTGYTLKRQSASDGRLYLYSATKGDDVVVRCAIPYSASLENMLAVDWTGLLVMLAVSVAMSVMAYLATRRLGKTIERLNLFAEKAEKGESFVDSTPFPNDELGSISNHIIRIYSQWQRTAEERDRAHENALREEQEKMRIKRQLTNNINHELKTPVASIQVCLETLLSGIKLSDEKRQELIERCYVNNDRLRRLLNDVSLITRIEGGSQVVGREKVVVNEVLNDIKEELAIMPEGERMQLHIDFPSIVTIEGNMSLICSVFSNLTENAMSYSGGKNIYISLLENSEKQCRIRFEDDGVGVEESQLPRLFERFYRVDKGRSRKKGGTGLGLAIVKHVVQFHGGTITVCNRPSGGLRFDFSLRKSVDAEV